MPTDGLYKVGYVWYVVKDGVSIFEGSERRARMVARKYGLDSAMTTYYDFTA